MYVGPLSDCCPSCGAAPHPGSVCADEPPITVHKVISYVPVSHDDLVDFDPSHVCGPDCPPEPEPLPPLPRCTRVRYALRRARWRLARLGGLRLVHKDRIDRDRDDD